MTLCLQGMQRKLKREGSTFVVLDLLASSFSTGRQSQRHAWHDSAETRVLRWSRLAQERQQTSRVCEKDDLPVLASCFSYCERAHHMVELL